MVWNGPDGPLMKNLNIVFSLLSLIGSAWMSYFCLNPHRMKSVLHQFIFSIAIIDLIFSLVNLISLAESYDPTPVEPLCKIEAILRFWCWRFSIILPTAIAFLCYKDSSRTEPEDTFDQSKFFKYVLGGFSALLLVMSLM